MDIGSASTIISGLISSIKDLSDLSEATDNQKLSGITLATSNQLTQLNLVIIDLQNENQRQMNEIIKLKQELQDRGNFIYKKNAAWKVTENGEEGPFCPQCYRKPIQQMIHGSPLNAYTCYACKATIELTQK